MGRGQIGTVAHQFQRLFGAGTIAGMTEWELLRLYLDRRDEDAFRAIVMKHGPMVMAVCRRVLGHSRDVEDAFQVTFLVLARKAAKLGENDPIGHWLYGVAFRVALRARTESGRRRSRERDGPAPEPSRDDDPSARELSGVIDEELARLPAKYRAPIVLCTIGGLTHEEAGRQLGWPVGTVKGRLSRARDLLKGRLSRRGMAPSLAVSLDGFFRQATAVVPASLAERTTQAAIAFATSRAAGMVSASAAALLEGWMSTMFLNKLKILTAMLLVLGAGAAVVAYQAPRGGEKTGQKPPDTVKSEGLGAIAQWPILSDPKANSSPVAKAILVELDKPIPMKFTDMPLDDIIRYLKESTKGPSLPNGIPIYVDPRGLMDADKTMASTISIDLDDVALKTTLKLALEQLSLYFRIKDGLMIITSTTSDDLETPFTLLDEKAEKGELSKDQYKEFIEILKLRNEVRKLINSSPQ